jgi:hypothetical protein
MPEHPHEGRLQAVAHLSQMYALADCAKEALAEDGIRSPLAAINDVRAELRRACDEIMEPCELVNVLDQVEDTIANGEDRVEWHPGHGGRLSIVKALVDQRSAVAVDQNNPLGGER